MVVTERCPQVLCRLLGLVAQQDRLVAWMQAESSAGSCRISLGIQEIDPRRAEIIADKMRSLVTVRAVRLQLS